METVKNTVVCSASYVFGDQKYNEHNRITGIKVFVPQNGHLFFPCYGWSDNDMKKCIKEQFHISEDIVICFN